MVKEKKYRAVSQLYNQYAKIITLFFLRKTSDIFIAEELMQETFLKLLESDALLNVPLNKRKNYLYKCARNKFVDHVRHNERLPSIDSSFEITHIEDSEEMLVEKSHIDGEVISALHIVIDEKIKRDEQVLIKKRYFLNQTISSICAESRISRYRFRRIIKSATDKVKDELAEYFSQ